MALLPMFLINTSLGKDKNSCYSNCILQLLRRTRDFKHQIEQSDATSLVEKELKFIFQSEGSNEIKSTAVLRSALGNDFSSGTQQDSKEFFDSLMSHLRRLNPIYGDIHWLDYVALLRDELRDELPGPYHSLEHILLKVALYRRKMNLPIANL